MAATLHYFMVPDDERSLFRHMERRELTLYPELVPPGWAPIRVEAAAVERMDAPAWYLAVERLGPVIVHPVKRGPDRGMLKIEEIPSPVFHYERSVRNDAGELVAGRLWAELEVTDDTNDRRGKPLALRAIFEEIHHLFRKSWRRSDPKGFWVGPHAAAAWKRGELVLREPGHKGGLVGVWR
ncbi:MAG TPA: hypothetical protein VLT61_13750 [Anaeromyxobacteraceae bacterium]|nr:hypothetical protein [Anaeromyxobacteraceae bacterium]